MSEQLARQAAEWVERFERELEVRGRSPRTRSTYRSDLRLFVDWLEKLPGLDALGDLGRAELSRYQQHLLTRRSLSPKRGRSLSVAARNRQVSALRSFFRFLVDQGVLLVNPADRLRASRHERRLPVVLTVREVIRLLGVIDVTQPLGQRDRAAVELLYGTGMRRAELVGLGLEDLDLEQQLVRVRGKGGKTRVVPAGSEAALALRFYLEQARPRLVFSEAEALFVNLRGTRMRGRELAERVKAYAREAGLRKRVTLHTLRHSCATHLLKGRADIRYIQALLGHAKLSTTQIYTRVEVADLREVLRLCHPREQQP